MITAEKILAQASNPTTEQTTTGVKDIGLIVGKDPLGSRLPADAPNALADIASTILGFLTLVAGLGFLLYFLLGGLQWLTSSGEAQKVESAKSQMVNAAIGFIVVVAAYAITGLIGMIFGVDILLTRPTETIDSLAPAAPE